ALIVREAGRPQVMPGGVRFAKSGDDEIPVRAPQQPFQGFALMSHAAGQAIHQDGAIGSSQSQLQGFYSQRIFAEALLELLDQPLWDRCLRSVPSPGPPLEDRTSPKACFRKGLRDVVHNAAPPVLIRAAPERWR